MNNMFVSSLLKSTKYSSVQGLRKISTLKEPAASAHDDELNRTVFQSMLGKEADLKPKTTDIQDIRNKIHKNLFISGSELEEMSIYYFNADGKFVRPRLSLTMAKAVNSHLQLSDPDVEEKQKLIAVISEMWHTSSLVHDDVIDHSEYRRGKQSINNRWGVSKSVLTGDYILAVSVRLLAETKDPEVVYAMSQILADLVNGEFQQMGTRSDDESRFQLYLDKTFNKTASLMAYSCKCVAMLACNPGNQQMDNNLPNLAYTYGRNVGLAFQLIDDWLDFMASAEQLGKPAGADLQLGLATAPVLFASKEFPRLDALIGRQFGEPTDVQEAFEIVLKSKGLDQTKDLARKYAEMALDNISGFVESTGKTDLQALAEMIVNRCS
ncbi:decaprenyl-diphosphate synthase subunit 1 [Eurytemora carolleeae]|uniref:decaprenyl-diphosphate synthase subunit 1 n=1 Tax=Eurytemora carolleeae TaxID=1294199 RepID=UPI000C792113|nr:decaprenyl-diphosphate synthase subunit 1 [Eurytemora carolleeae]|eukprot:XP_023326668.1 decaprenyl-diphosphate synthase subunit 1-like [Eurytemora affinis]